MKNHYKLITFICLSVFTLQARGQSPLNPGFEAVNSYLTDWKNTPNGTPYTGLGARSTATARTGSYSFLTASTISSGGSISHQNVSNLTVLASNWVHVIGWAKGFNAFSKAAMGGTLTPGSGNNATTAAVNSTSFSRLVYNVQNGASEAVFKCGIYFKSTDGTDTKVYFDDVIAYTDNTATEDNTSPTVASSFTTGVVSANSISFSWTNGSDAATGIQNSIILRTTNTSAAAPVMNNQGVYSTNGGESGPSTVSTDWTVISTSVAAVATSYTDNTVTSSKGYKYAIIHRDMAYNYSTALVGSTITTSALSVPVVSASTSISTTGFTTNWSAVTGATVYRLDVNPSTVFPFSEDFYKCFAGTPGGSNGTDIASTINNYMQSSGWIASTAFQGGGSIRIGAGGSIGFITTPTIDLSANGGAATVSFDCMAYTGESNVPYQVWHAADGSTFVQVGSNLSAVTTSFANQTVQITGGTVNSKIKITTTAINNRVVLDNLKVYQTDNISGFDNLTISSATSQTVTGLSANTPYYYRIRAIDATGSSAYSATATAITSLSGALNASVLPTCTTCDLNIASGGELNLNASKEFNSITVAPGAKVTMTSNYTLSATNGITLLSDATGTATLVDNNTTDPQAVVATVQQHVTEGRNWYMSIPLADASKSIFNRGTSVVAWNESAGTVGAWEEVSATGNALEKMRGYIQVATTTPEVTGTTGILEFNGTLNTGAHSIATLTRTAGKTGFNLVGNPYPSYLNWNLVDRTNVLPTMWFRTKVGGVYKFYTYLNGSGAGEVGSVTVPAGVSNLIPPMQAFWVRVENVGTGSITVDNTMRAHKDISGNIIKAPKQNPNRLLRLQVSNGTNDDETVLYFNENASNDFDSYDATKMLNNATNVPDIFTTVGSEKLVINGMKEIAYNTEIPLGFTTGAASDFTLAASELSNFDAGTRIFLKDNLNPTIEFELTQGASYNFSSQVTTPSTDRFSLIFRAPGVTTDVEKSRVANAQVFVNAANQITIIAPEKSAYSIYNTVGQLMENGAMTSNSQTSNFKLTNDMYVVKVNNSITKVIIK